MKVKKEWTYRLEILPIFLGDEDYFFCDVYYLRSKVKLFEDDLARISATIFSDKVLQKFSYKRENDKEFFKEKELENYNEVYICFFKAGVTDQKGIVAKEALGIFGYHEIEVHSGTIHFLSKNKAKDEEFKKTLANPLIQFIQIEDINKYFVKDRFLSPCPSSLIPDLSSRKKNSPIQVYEFSNLSDEELLNLSDKSLWALSSEELKYIRKYYEKSNVQQERVKLGLPKGLTDVEIEVIAQSWSEHCKHKIFQAIIDYSEENLGERKSFGERSVDGLFSTYIRDPSFDIIKQNGYTWALSLFKDNAGVVSFSDYIYYCLKVETHNGPSVLDPYGGALTGILGVNRDILGTGLGARPIANTNVLCFAGEEIYKKKLADGSWPRNIKRPKNIRDGVHKGIKDGGNKSGIPTVNGAFFYDDSYLGRPLVYCGTLGVMPKKVWQADSLQFVPSYEKKAKLGDLVVMVGGKVGADGLHGATFSSQELTDDAPSSAVQIGDPLIQKKVLDFLLEAQKKGLFSSITDNGAGGLSSSVGEMSLEAGGVKIDLTDIPLKYEGLLPFEILLSESQERMTFAVSPNLWTSFQNLAMEMEVEASAIGEFNNSGYFDVVYRDEQVAHLSLEFLHESLPKMSLKAIWDGEKSEKQTVYGKNLDKILESFSSSLGEERPLWLFIYDKLKENQNFASHSSFIDQYDQGVQGGTLIGPMMGDGGLIWSYPHGGGRKEGVCLSSGLSSFFSHVDPYLMGQLAVDEAVRNNIAVGGEMKKMAILDNFCWPDPIGTEKNSDGFHYLGMLVRTCEGLKKAAEMYGVPMISGKDSMKNNYRGKTLAGEEVSIPIIPTLLVTAMGHVSDITHTTTQFFKSEDDHIYLLGEAFFLNESRENELPLELLKSLYEKINKAQAKGILHSCHDISWGGAMMGLVECANYKKLGFSFDEKFMKEYDEKKLIQKLYAERVGQFIISVSDEYVSDFEEHFENFAKVKIGKVIKKRVIRLGGQDYSF